MYFLKIENTYDGLALQEGKHFSPERVHLLIMESGFPLSEKSLKAMAVILILFPVRNPFLLELQWVYKHCSYKRTPLLTFA